MTLDRLGGYRQGRCDRNTPDAEQAEQDGPLVPQYPSLFLAAGV
jgi:hypothetical protein